MNFGVPDPCPRGWHILVNLSAQIFGQILLNLPVSVSIDWLKWISFTDGGRYHPISVRSG